MAQRDPLTDDEWAAADAIEGWLFRSEADLLNRLNMGTWCEAGSWKGRSTFVLSLRNRGYAIDWFNGISDPEYDLQGVNTYAEFRQNIEPHAGRVKVLPLTFQAAAQFVTEPLRLLFLDGEHSYAMTRAAFELYSPKVALGGHVVFHDAWGENGETDRTPLPQVTRYVKELIQHPDWYNVENVARCAVFRSIR